MEKIAAQLERMNETLTEILDFMKKPERKMLVVLQYASGVVGIFGVIAIMI